MKELLATNQGLLIKYLNFFYPDVTFLILLRKAVILLIFTNNFCPIKQQLQSVKEYLLYETYKYF